MIDEPRRSYDQADFAFHFGMARSTFYEYLKSGVLRGTKIGRRTVVLREDVDAWLAGLPKRQAVS